MSKQVTVKDGWTTTEFWQTLLVNVCSIAVAVAALSGNNVDSSGLKALIPAASTIAAALVTARYSHSRAVVKSAAHAANAQILSSQPTPAAGVGQADESSPLP